VIRARSQPVTSELRAAILELIASPLYPYLITTTSRDLPYTRPVICVNDGFVIRMVTRRGAVKLRHLARNPNASLLWCDAAGTPARSVLLQGRVEVIDDLAAVREFAARYAVKNPSRRRGWDASEDTGRVVLELTPTFCRADWFAGFVPVILRPVDLLPNA